MKICPKNLTGQRISFSTPATISILETVQNEGNGRVGEKSNVQKMHFGYSDKPIIEMETVIDFVLKKGKRSRFSLDQIMLLWPERPT